MRRDWPTRIFEMIPTALAYLTTADGSKHRPIGHWVLNLVIKALHGREEFTLVSGFNEHRLVLLNTIPDGTLLKYQWTQW